MYLTNRDTLTSIDSTYTYWFPIGIVGFTGFLIFLKSPNIWSESIVYIYAFILIINSLFKLYKIYSITKWIKVDATVEDVKYKEWYEVDRWIKIKKFTPLLTYSYQLNGEKNTKDTISLFGILFEMTTEQNGEKEIEDFLQKYSVGKNIQVFVNPKNTDEALLYNYVHWSFVAKYVITLLIGTIALIGVISIKSHL